MKTQQNKTAWWSPASRRLARLATFALAVFAAGGAWAEASLEETGGFVTTSSQLAFKNATLEDLTADTLHGRFSGAWAGTAKGSTLTFNTFATPDANTKTCEAKLLNDGYVKGVLLTFTQNGDDVEVQMTGGKYLTGSDITASIASGTDGSYSVCHLRLSRTPELYGGATVTWEAGEFANTKVGIDGNEYTITLPASGMSIDETTKNLVVAASGATTGATIDLPSDIEKASVLIKYSSLAAVSDKNVTLSTIKYPNEYVIGTRTSANNALTLTGYFDAASDNNYPNNNATYGSGTVPTLPSGSGYFIFAHYPGNGTGNGTYSYAGYSPFTLAGGSNSQIRWSGRKIGQISIGGPISSQRVYAWPNVEIEGVALYVGSIKTADDVIDFIFTPTAEATIDADGTYTLAGDNNLFDSIAADGEYVINVNEDATLNIPSATSVNMITFNVAANKTLTLTGNTLTAAGGIKVTGEGKVYTTAMSVLSGPIKGDGTLCYDMNNGTTKPTGLTCTKAAWKGVLWIKNSAYAGWNFSSYGSTASTVRIENVTCYLDGSETLNSTLDLVGEGLKITNGNSQRIETLTKLTGDGSLTISGTGGSSSGNGIVIQDSSEFTGTIGNSVPDRYLITFGASGSYGTSGKVVIASGRTATIANGKTWSVVSGFDVSGTLAFTGTGKASGLVTTVNGSTLDLSGFTGEAPAISGALTLASGTTIKLPAGTTLPYQIASSGDGIVDNVTVEIDGGATTTSAVKLANGAISLAKSATLSNSPEMKNFSGITWSSVTSSDYLLTISGTPTLLNFDDITGVDSLKIVVQNSSELYVKGEMPANTTVEGLTNLTIVDGATASFYAGYTRLYAQIGDTTTGNDAISATGTTISVSDPMSAPLNAGNYVIARWLTPQKLSTGYGHVNTVSATLNTASTPGLTAELVYCVDRIVLRVYDSSIVPAEDGTGTLKIWPYGDSITEGYNMGGTKANYRVLLAQKLTLLGFNVEMVGSYDKINGANAIDPAGNIVKDSWKWHSAKHGATAGPTTNYKRGNLCENVDTLAAQVGNPDVVLLHIGVNDLAESAYDQNTTFVSLTNVVQHLVDDLPNSKIVVSTALRQLEPYRSNTEIDAYNVLIRGIMADMPSAWTGHVLFADLATFVDSQDSGILYAGSGDNLHPDWWGHNQMAEGWLSVVASQFTPSQQFNASKGPAVATESLGAANKAELVDYRRGFKRYGVINVPGAAANLDPSSLSYFTSVDEMAATSGIARVGYFVEYVRTDNNAHKWVWVDMDAFGSTISELGLPSANHQQVVNNLHVKSNHNGINDVAADDNSVQGFVEFSPYNYGGANSGITGAPDGNSGSCDWNDTLSSSGSFSCMQVHRIAPPSGRGGQVLFAFNNWNGFDSNPPEFGIGNCSQHFYTTGADACSFDYTHTRTLSKLNASAYTVKTIEVWTNSDKLEFSNDLKGSSHANNASFPATEVFKITMPASAGTVKIDSIVLGSRGDKSEEIPANAYMTISTAMGTVATSLVINGDGNPQFTDTFADGGYKQTYTFGEDCLLEGGTSYILSVLNPSGEKFRLPAQLENYDTADAYSVISNTVNVVNNWRITQTVYASKVYESTLTSGANTFSGLTFSPSLPPDASGSALLVNVPAATTATMTFGSATTVGSIRFNIPDGSTLTIADPSYLTAGKIVVYGTGTLSFGASPDFGDADIEIVDDATLELAVGQTLTTTGDVTIDSGATLTLAPATIAGTSASLVSATAISGEFGLTAPDEGSDYSINVTATAVTLRRVTKEAFAYDPYPGQNTPSGWITSWGGEPLATTSLRVGPSSDIPYVYHVASGKHPWVNLAARTSGFSYAIYADVSQMESDKGVITAFGNTSKGLFLYRDGNYVKLAHVVNSSITTLDWVPGVAISAGYHLYTVTFDPTTGAAALYLDDGSTYAATDGSTHAHLGTQGLNNGFQLGSVFQGVGTTGFHVGAGLAVCAVRGYDVVLDSVEVGVLAETFQGTEGNISWDVNPEASTGNTYIVTSTTVDDSHYLGITLGTLTIPEGSTVNTKHVRVLNSGYTDDRATVNVAGTLNVTSTSSNPNVWAERESLKGILFGHWHGQATYNITGSLIGENAYLETVYTAESQTINIDGADALVKVKGLFAKSGNQNSTVNLTNGGTLEVKDIPTGGAPITYNFAEGTYRITGGDATVSTPITFTGTSAAPTTIDPYGNTITMAATSLNGNQSAYITVADSSESGNGVVKFPALPSGNAFSGWVILDDTNAANIDLSDYTGKVAVRGGAITTLAKLAGFSGIAVFDTAGTYDARGVDLSGVNIQINNASAKLIANAGQEGTVTVVSGALDLYLTNDQFLTLGYVCPDLFAPVGATLTYYHGEARTEGTVQWASGEELSTDELEVVQAGNSIAPYYRIFCGVSDGTTGTLSEITHWEKSPDALPTSGNMAIRVTGNKTLTVNIDNTTTFGEVQVFGSGTVIFTGSGTMTVTRGIYATSGTSFSINGGIAENLNVYAHDLGTWAQIACGTEADPYDVAYASGAGNVVVDAGAYVNFAAASVDNLYVRGTANVGEVDSFRVNNIFHIYGTLNFASTTFGTTILRNYANISVFNGGTVNLTGTAGVATTSLKVEAGGTVNVASTATISTPVTGAGRVAYTGKCPDVDSTSNWWKNAGTSAANGWRGTLAIKDWNHLTDNQWAPGNYGNQYSTLEADNCNVYYFEGSGSTTTCALKVAAGGLTVKDGSSNAVNNFAALSGTGCLHLASGTYATQTYKFADATDFSGSITNGTFKVVFGSSAGESSTITVDSGNTVNLAAGKILNSENIKLNGTLALAGAGSLEGAVTLNGGAQINLASSPLVVNGTLTLPESGTVTINPGSIDLTSPDGVALITGVTASEALADGTILTSIAVSGHTDLIVAAKTNTSDSGKRDIVVYKTLPVTEDSTSINVSVGWAKANAPSIVSGATTISGLQSDLATRTGANGYTYYKSYALGLTPATATSKAMIGGGYYEGSKLVFTMPDVIPPTGVTLTVTVQESTDGSTWSNVAAGEGDTVSVTCVGDGATPVSGIIFTPSVTTVKYYRLNVSIASTATP